MIKIKKIIGNILMLSPLIPLLIVSAYMMDMIDILITVGIIMATFGIVALGWKLQDE